MNPDDPTISFDHHQDDPGRIPEHIGPFKIIQRLGDGGFGVVYEAQQTEPIKRRVALKVIKPGMDSAAVLTRFEAERQTLAVMDHPCIAKVFDAGMTEQGRPYFAMELVRGEPLTDFCDRNRIALPDRLTLFMRICDAVQHAHTKGVVHRDLKPSNILVSYQDNQITPKVIDFGIAKALHQKLSDQSLYTQQGQLIGTPEYMSPEQAEMGITDIDTRSDIYSLGVILYELLTGARPFESETLRRAGLAEIQRIIRETDPPKPSTRLASIVSHQGDPDTATRIAHARRTELRSLSTTLRRDLDWVVMKCLEKDRARRYDTASALAMEIQRYLNNEPVIAGPPSAMYRSAKFVRRHRAQLATLAAITLILAASAIAIITNATQAKINRDRAQSADRYAAAINTFMSQELIGAADPDQLGSGATIHEALQNSLATLTTELESHPKLQSSVALSIANAMVRAGALDNAHNALTIARDALHQTTPDQQTQRIADEIELLHNVILWREGNPDASNQLEDLFERVRARTESDNDKAFLITIEHDLASSIKNTAHTLPYDQRLAALDQAESHYRAVAQAREAILGQAHPDAITARYNLALIHIARAQAHAARSQAPGDEFDTLRSEEHTRALEDLRTLRSDALSHRAPKDRIVEIDSEIAKQLSRLSRWTEADNAYATTTDTLLEILGPSHWRTSEFLYSWELLHRRWSRSPDTPELQQRREITALTRALSIALMPSASQVNERWKQDDPVLDDPARRAVRLAELYIESARTDEARSLLLWADTRLELIGEHQSRTATKALLDQLRDQESTRTQDPGAQS